jgi:Protein of unknown function (DUF2934)
MTPSLTNDQEATRKQTTQQPDQEMAGRSGQGNEGQIAEIAYYKAESLGFTPGHELIDWLEAEQELTLTCEDEEQPNKNPSLPIFDQAIG